MNSLSTLKSMMEEKLNSRQAHEQFRHGYRMIGNFQEKVIADISNLLEFDFLSWMLRNGYKPEDSDNFLKIFTEEFDYGNQVGIACQVDVVKDDGDFPLAARILLELINKNKKDLAELKSAKRSLAILRPAWVTKFVYRFVSWFKPQSY